MGLLTWAYEHHPESRMNRVVYEMKHSPADGVKQFLHESSGFASDVGFVAGAIVSRGQSLTGRTQTDLVLRQGIFYDPMVIDYRSTLGGQIAHHQKLQRQSLRQDMTLSVSTGRQIPKTRGGTKFSRAAKSALSTVKPFWSNGKPKCREGYRYDFLRKLCVKKS